MEANEIFSKISDFLQRSSARYYTDIKRQERDFDAFNGNFWTDDLKKEYHRTAKRKLNLHFGDTWNVLSNSIVSPFGKSSWHINLLDADEDDQDIINEYENRFDTKSVKKAAFRKATIAGAGFVCISVEDEKPVLELVKNNSSVALDPCIETVDCSDAEEGAIVNYISINKAKRLFGEDVVPYNYPRTEALLKFTNNSQFADCKDKVQVVNYYVKENGGVHYYKVCGNKVVNDVMMPISIIPIIRFAGYECSNNDYIGIVSKTFTQQVSLNIAYSTLMERANKSIRATFSTTPKAIENLHEYYQRSDEQDALFLLHNDGTDAPVIIPDNFNTADLQNLIDILRNSIADTIGIPLSGVVGDEDKTATEILIQNNSRESNVLNFYDNSYAACRSIGRILVELLLGEGYQFDLENGPDTITNNMKKRQELSVLSSLIPPEMQPLLAIKMCDTFDGQFIEDFKKNIIANTSLKLVSESEDPYAIQQLEQMKMTMDQMMQELDTVKAENVALTDEKKQLELALSSSKEQMILDYQKHQDDMELKRADMQLKFAEKGVQLENDKTRDEIEIEKQMLELEQQRMKLIGETLKANDKPLKANDKPLKANDKPLKSIDPRYH